MAEYNNQNRGVLFANNRKETEKHPDFKGRINVDGVNYWLDAWQNEGKPGSKIEGQTYYSLSIKRMDDQSREAPRAATPTPNAQDMREAPLRRAPTTPVKQPLRQELDDEIPFMAEFR